MKRIAFLLTALLGFQVGWTQENQIREVIDKMFEGLYKGDTTVLRTCFVPGASLMTYEYDSRGNPRAKGNLLPDFLLSVAKMGAADMEEKLTGWQCLVDDGIASVWTPYEFYYEGKFSHCGVNSFQLMQVQGEWKITMITDTRRRKECVTDQEVIAEIDSLMNLWHHAAATADEEAFFGRMSADGIYIGTDASERWLRDELKTWSMKYFERESAWNFKPLSRNISLGPGGQIAWFDELLETWMGTCRSTGILEKRNGHWKIVHYHLAVTLPNELMDGFRTLIGKDK